MPFLINRTKNIVQNNYAYIPLKSPRYQMNDLMSVYTHYEPAAGKNVSTKNNFKGDVNSGKSCK